MFKLVDESKSIKLVNRHKNIFTYATLSILLFNIY